MIVLLCHLAAIVHYIEYDIRAVNFIQQIFSDIQPYKDHVFTCLLQLCTLWNLVFQQIYLLAVTIDDVYRLASRSNGNQKRVFTHQRISSVFIRYIFPFSIVVSTNFWIVFSVNPRYVDEHNTFVTHITEWDNHGMHTIPVVFVFLELFAAHRLYPRVLVTELWASVTLTLIYLVFVAAIIPGFTFWVYPFFGMFRWYHWAIYIPANLLLACFGNIVGYVLSGLIWGKHSTERPHLYEMKQKTN